MRKRKWIGETEVERLGKIAHAKWRQASEYIFKNMAKERQGRVPNVQDFVQSILSAVTNLQHSSQTREETTVSQGGSVQKFTSLPEELNSRFRIPRTQNSSPKCTFLRPNCEKTNINIEKHLPVLHVLIQMFYIYSAILRKYAYKYK
jgi:hypothetical protein